MAVTLLADRQDVIAIIGPLTPAQEAVVDGLLLNASVKVYLLAQRAGIDLASLDEIGTAAVTAAVVNAVVRVLRNPEGIRQFQNTRTAGPYSETEGGTRADDSASGGLYIADGDLPWTLGNDQGWVGTARLRGVL